MLSELSIEIAAMLFRLISSFCHLLIPIRYLKLKNFCLGNTAEAYDRTMKEAIQLTKYVLCNISF